MEIEEIFNATWKGFLNFNEYSPKEKEVYKKEYSPNEIMNIIKFAYNQAIDDAIKNTNFIYGIAWETIDKEGLLKLKK